MTNLPENSQACEKVDHRSFWSYVASRYCSYTAITEGCDGYQEPYYVGIGELSGFTYELSEDRYETCFERDSPSGRLVYQNRYISCGGSPNLKQATLDAFKVLGKDINLL